MSAIRATIGRVLPACVIFYTALDAAPRQAEAATCPPVLATAAASYERANPAGVPFLQVLAAATSPLMAGPLGGRTAARPTNTTATVSLG